jgi:hypothetical protein
MKRMPPPPAGARYVLRPPSPLRSTPGSNASPSYRAAVPVSTTAVKLSASTPPLRRRGVRSDSLGERPARAELRSPLARTPVFEILNRSRGRPEGSSVRAGRSLTRPSDRASFAAAMRRYVAWLAAGPRRFETTRCSELA